ncbi:hypothetical protein COV17_00155 [Candidatus Woesearchaeota archaeon CG10_big_fil_rev_8_21_14_0_10_36_11]|nr:MAG: hypothetical protein COV17_00155 [Candidatus Woesearchaeota archaeon CG10_big_fil_rev_8_21_14_0_10_36_11]
MNMNSVRQKRKERYLYDSRGYNSGADNFDNGVSNKFSQRNHHGLWWDYRRAQEFVQLLNAHKITLKNATILDIGCHHGFFTSCLAYIKKSSSGVYGVDFIQDSITIARQFNPGITFVQGDVYDMPYKDGFFNVVLCNYVFNAIPHKDISQIAANISSKVKSGGHIIFFDFYNSPFINFCNRLLYGNIRKTRKLPTFDNTIIKEIFPEYEIVESKKIINIFRLPMLLKFKLPYWLVSFLDVFFPKYYYLGLLRKK